MRSRSPGRYEPIQLLGHGPYGTVSLARDGFCANRLVAVKVLDSTALPQRALTRIRRELALRRGLRHPNLAAVFDLDFDEAGNCRIASEFAPGGDFLTGARDLSPEALGERAVQLLHALGHLHDCGVVHGALKPSNVRLSPGSSGPVVKVLDFDLRADNDVSPTEHAGTLHHAAPEVLRGRTADAAADLYAVGILLYHAIAGRLPFDDPEHGPGVVGWHLSRSVRRAPEGHPLGAVTGRLLDPDPAQRFQSAHEVVRAIGAALGRKFRSRAVAGGEQVLITGRLLGRDREIKRASAACRRIQNGAGAQVLVLRGPEGIGKSRMLEECRVLAQMAGIRVAHATCRSERSAPLALLRALLRQILLLVGPDHAIVDANRALLRDVLPELFGSEGKPPSRLLPDEHGWMRVKNGAAEFLAAAAQLRPLALLIDDLQAIDEASLGVLTWLLQHFPGCPLLLFAATQEGAAETPAAASRLIESDAHEVIRLGPLHQADVEQLLAGVLALPGSVSELGGFVSEVTGGVPLYVEETVRALVEGQVIEELVQDAPRARGDREATARERVLDLAGARIARVPDPARRMLEALCVFDGTAAQDELQAVVGAGDAEFEATLRRLEAADLVRVEPGAGGPAVAIRTALFREAAASRVPPERLAELHDAMVDRLEATAPGPADRAFAMAWHAVRGTRPGKALELSLGAAREAAALGAHDRARELLERARKLAAAASDSDALRAAGALLGETLDRLGKPEAALALFTEIAGSPQATKAETIGATLRIAELQARLGRPELAERSIAAAAGEARALGDPALTTLADRLHARMLVRRGLPEHALPHLDRARASLEAAGDARALAHVVSETGEARFLLDELEPAWLLHRESLVRFLRLRDPAGVALAHLNLGLVAWKAGRSADALARLQRSERLARRFGHYALLARALHHRGAAEAGLGRLADAVRTLTISVNMMRRLDDEPGICDGLIQLASTHHAAGRHEMARVLVEEAVARRGRLNDLSSVAEARILLGRLSCVIGALDDAEAILRTAADAAEHIGLASVAGGALRGLAEVALQRDLPREALAILARPAALAAERRDQALATRIALLRADAAFRLGAPDRRVLVARVIRAARAHPDAEVLAEARRLAGSARQGRPGLEALRAAQRHADRAGFREIAWRVRADLGRRLLDGGFADQAVEVLKEAMALLRTLHDELPVRRRAAYLADPRKLALREAFALAIDRSGATAA
jgi:tetratricopeptide (TPR) repeat protein